MYDAPDGASDAPKGVTTSLLRDGSLIAAANSDSHSQLRIWDVRSGGSAAGGGGGSRDRVSLPPYVKGVRCLARTSEATILCGTATGGSSSLTCAAGGTSASCPHRLRQRARGRPRHT